MRVTHHAAVIVGCRVDKSEIFFEEEVRSCEHRILEGNAKFCPYCGKELWIQIDKSIPQYNENEKTLCGFRVFHNKYDDFVFVAGEFTEIDNYSDTPLEMLDAAACVVVQRKLKFALRPLHLWNEKQFGIWVVMWRS